MISAEEENEIILNNPIIMDYINRTLSPEITPSYDIKEGIFYFDDSNNNSVVIFWKHKELNFRVSTTTTSATGGKIIEEFEKDKHNFMINKRLNSINDIIND